MDKVNIKEKVFDALGDEKDVKIGSLASAFVSLIVGVCVLNMLNMDIIGSWTQNISVQKKYDAVSPLAQN